MKLFVAVLAIVGLTVSVLVLGMGVENELMRFITGIAMAVTVIAFIIAEVVRQPKD